MSSFLDYDLFSKHRRTPMKLAILALAATLDACTHTNPRQEAFNIHNPDIFGKNTALVGNDGVATTPGHENSCGMVGTQYACVP